MIFSSFMGYVFLFYLSLFCKKAAQKTLMMFGICCTYCAVFFCLPFLFPKGKVSRFFEKKL